MKQAFLNAIYWIFGLGSVFLLILIIITEKKAKKQVNANEENLEEEFEKDSFFATVTDMHCSTEVIGIRNPKNVRSFAITFELEGHEVFVLPVNEEQYDGFDIGQRGILTVVDGELYSFELESI